MNQELVKDVLENVDLDFHVEQGGVGKFSKLCCSVFVTLFLFIINNI